jgi:predicted acyltransferase
MTSAAWNARIPGSAWGAMNTATITNPQHISVDGAGESFVTRIQSIDIFRGITLAVMIFVNDLDETRNLPWWTFHANRNWDVMTHVDMVFPIFLFLVGMSLPIAINARLRRNRLCARSGDMSSSVPPRLSSWA